MVVECVVGEDDDHDLDAALDALADSVRLALLSHDLWLGLFEAVTAVAQQVGYSSNAGRHRAVAVLTFTVQDHVAVESARQANAVTLDTTHVTVKTGGDATPVVDVTIDKVAP